MGGPRGRAALFSILTGKPGISVGYKAATTVLKIPLKWLFPSEQGLYSQQHTGRRAVNAQQPGRGEQEA